MKRPVILLASVVIIASWSVTLGNAADTCSRIDNIPAGELCAGDTCRTCVLSAEDVRYCHDRSNAYGEQGCTDSVTNGIYCCPDTAYVAKVYDIDPLLYVCNQNEGTFHCPRSWDYGNYSTGHATLRAGDCYNNNPGNCG